MREHLPVLFLTGAVPVNTIGLNASQELDAEPIFRPVTKYSTRVDQSKDLLKEIVKAVEIAVSGVPGPVHIAMPIDIQHEEVELQTIPVPPKRKPIVPKLEIIKEAADSISKKEKWLYLSRPRGSKFCRPAFGTGGNSAMASDGYTSSKRLCQGESSTFCRSFWFCRS